MAPSSCFSRSAFSFLLILFVTSISTAAGGLLGVDYGRDASNIISPQRVVELLKANGIGAAAIYDDDVGVIQAFRDSGVKLVVSLRNEKLADAARDPNYAGTWVWEHVGKFFPATQIEAIAVGNEVLDKRLDLAQHLLPAMQNVYNAVKNLGHADRIKISTPVAFSAVSVSFPPSQGRFRGDLKDLVRQLLGFLQRTDSYFMVNLYPFITYRDVPNIDLDYFLGQPSYSGVRDPVSGRTYKRLLDAQIDATYTAMADLGFGVSVAPTATTVGASLQQRGVKRKITVRETGCPNCSGGRRRRNVQVTEAGGGMLNTSLAEKGCSLSNAQTYNRNLVERMLSGQTGTPLFPDADLDVYIFSLFNENLKPGPESEKSFGLFYPDGNKVYDLPSFSPAGGGGGSWCVANPAVGQQRMQAALDWACGQGGADCGPIQRGAACYEPNTVEAHASYAMNSYYQRRGRDSAACNFSGVGRIVNQRPSERRRRGTEPPPAAGTNDGDAGQSHRRRQAQSQRGRSSNGSRRWSPSGDDVATAPVSVQKFASDSDDRVLGHRSALPPLLRPFVEHLDVDRLDGPQTASVLEFAVLSHLCRRSWRHRGVDRPARG